MKLPNLYLSLKLAKEAYYRSFKGESLNSYCCLDNFDDDSEILRKGVAVNFGNEFVRASYSIITDNIPSEYYLCEN